MKTRVLVDTLKMLVPGLAKGDIVEQFSCFFFEGKTIRSTDGRIFLRAVLDEDTGLNCALPGRVLYTFLDSITDEEINIEQAEGVVKISGQSLEGDLFSKTSEVSGVRIAVSEPAESEWIDLPTGLIQALGLCKFSASTDATTGPLTSVHVRDNFALSCDRYRITKCLFDGTVSIPMNISVQAVIELEKHIGQVNAFCVKESAVFFKLYDGKVILGAGLVSGDYPDMSRFFRDLTATEFIEIPDAILPALDRQILIQKDLEVIDMGMDVFFDPSNIVLHSVGQNAGEITEQISCEIPESFRDCAFRINPKFFKEILEISRRMLYVPEQKLLFFESANLTHMVKTKE